MFSATGRIRYSDKNETWDGTTLITEEKNSNIIQMEADCFYRIKFSRIYTLDILFDGPGGWPIEDGWWNKTPEQFQDQVKRYCPMCSASIPLEILSDHADFDYVSKGNAKKLEEIQSPKFLKSAFKIYDKKYTLDDYKANYKTWAPGRYRDFIQHEPGNRIISTMNKDES